MNLEDYLDTGLFLDDRDLRRHVREKAAGLDVLNLFAYTGAVSVAAAMGGAHSTTSVDLSASMLAQASGERTRASAFALPFQDDTFDLVVCCRLVHHLTTDVARAALLKELGRVGRGPVALSYWDAGSWHALRRRRGWRRDTDTRVATPAANLDSLLAAAGLRPIARTYSMRLVSPQTWVLAVPQ